MSFVGLDFGKRIITASPQCSATSTQGWDTAESTSRCTTNIVCSSGNCTVSIINEPMQAACTANVCNFRFSDGTDIKLLCDGTTRTGNSDGVTCATSCVCTLKSAVSSTSSRSSPTSSPTNATALGQESGGLSGGALAGIIIGSLALFLLLLVAGFVLYKRMSADSKPPKDLREKQTIVVQESTATLNQRNTPVVDNILHDSPTQMSNGPVYYDPNYNQQQQFYQNQQGYYQQQQPNQGLYG